MGLFKSIKDIWKEAKELVDGPGIDEEKFESIESKMHRLKEIIDSCPSDMFERINSYQLIDKLVQFYKVKYPSSKIDNLINEGESYSNF